MTGIYLQDRASAVHSTRKKKKKPSQTTGTSQVANQNCLIDRKAKNKQNTRKEKDVFASSPYLLTSIPKKCGYLRPASPVSTQLTFYTPHISLFNIYLTLVILGVSPQTPNITI